MQPYYLFFRTARLDAAFSRKICKGEVEPRRAVNKYSQKYFTQKRLSRAIKEVVGMLSVTDVSGSALPNDSSDVTLQQQHEVACYKEEVLLKAAKSSTHVSRWDHCSRSNSQAAGNTKAGHIFQNLFLWQIVLLDSLFSTVFVTVNRVPYSFIQV